MELQIGQVATFKRIFTQEDFDRFADLSGDDNPIHVDPEFSARTRFGKTLCHGMLLYSTICRMLGVQFPGPGTVQVEQELMFPGPTFAGDEVTVRVEVTALHPEKQLADLSTVITREDGSVSCQGHTLARLPSLTPLAESPLQDLPPIDSAAGKPGSETMKRYALGQQAATKRVFTDANLAEYADLTGDTNPIFTDGGYARQIGLDGPMIPGGLLGGMFSYLLGTELPGRGTNWLKQKLRFPAPAYPGEEITARVEIIRLRPEKDLVNLRTVCTNPTGTVVCVGEALVLAREMEE